MKIKERLLECKVKLGLDTDYKLAKALKINRARIHDYMTGKRHPDAYTAVQIGETLGIHPMQLLAEFEEEAAKTDERRAFWANFTRRIKSGIVGMLALSFTGICWPEHAQAARLGLDTHNVYYVKLC